MAGEKSSAKMLSAEINFVFRVVKGKIVAKRGLSHSIVFPGNRRRRCFSVGLNNMVYDSAVHRRRSIRYKDYDYVQDGTYFITICAQDMKCVFGEIQKGKMELNEAGKIARACWREIPKHYPFVALDEFVVMPNHFHGVIAIQKQMRANDYSPVLLDYFGVCVMLKTQ